MDDFKGLEFHDTAKSPLAIWLRLDSRHLSPRAVLTLVRHRMALPPANNGLWGEI